MALSEPLIMMAVNEWMAQAATKVALIPFVILLKEILQQINIIAS